MRNINKEIFATVEELDSLTDKLEKLIIDKLKVSKDNMVVIGDDYSPISLPIEDGWGSAPNSSFLNGIRLDDDGDISLLFYSAEDENLGRENILDEADELSFENVALPRFATLYIIASEIGCYE